MRINSTIVFENTFSGLLDIVCLAETIQIAF